MVLDEMSWIQPFYVYHDSLDRSMSNSRVSGQFQLLLLRFIETSVFDVIN